MGTEMKYSAVWSFQICDEDGIIQEFDIDNTHSNSHPIQEHVDDDEKDDSHAIFADNNDVGEINVVDVKDKHMNIVKIGDLYIFLCCDYLNVVGTGDGIWDLLSCTRNSDDGSSGDEGSYDDDTINEESINEDNGPPLLISTPDEHIADGEDDFDQKG